MLLALSLSLFVSSVLCLVCRVALSFTAGVLFIVFRTTSVHPSVGPADYLFGQVLYMAKVNLSPVHYLLPLNVSKTKCTTKCEIM